MPIGRSFENKTKALMHEKISSYSTPHRVSEEPCLNNVDFLAREQGPTGRGPVSGTEVDKMYSELMENETSGACNSLHVVRPGTLAAGTQSTSDCCRYCGVGGVWEVVCSG
ncbi:unnamed protein product [Sphacelaria rigidula]